MIKFVLFFLLLSFPASAATFKSVEEDDLSPHGIIWHYVFSTAGTNTPLHIVENSCFKMKRGNKMKIVPEGKDISENWKCFNDESAARVAAQKDADQFEKDLPERMKPQ